MPYRARTSELTLSRRNLVQLDATFTHPVLRRSRAIAVATGSRFTRPYVRAPKLDAAAVSLG